MKPQAKATALQPPQFGHDGIDPLRALLILGLPLAVAAVTLLVLFASPLVWWIAAGVTAAGVLGGVLLRRTKKGRSLLNRVSGRLPGGLSGGRPGLRRTGDGRFARSPLGRVVNRALGRRPGSSPGGGTGGSASRPKTLGGKLRSLLPSWAGGARKPSSSNRAGGPGGSSSGGRSGGRMRSLLNRLKPGGGRRPGASGGASPSGSKTKPKSLLGRAASSVRNATGRASRAAASKLFRIRPGASSPSGGGGSSKPKGKGKPSSGGGSGGKDAPLDLGVVWTGAGKARRLLGRGVAALFGRLRKHGPSEDDEGDDFDPDATYEVGIDGTKVNGELRDDDVEEAKARAKARRKAEKKAAKAAPVWPNLDVDEVPLPPVQEPQQEWPSYDVDDYAPKSEQRPPQPPTRSLPAEQGHDPPPSLPVSPPPHREAPRITSTNTGGSPVSSTVTSTPSSSGADAYIQMIDQSTPVTYASSCQEAAAQARRDSTAKEQQATKLRQQAEEFASKPGAGNQKTANDLRGEAAKCDQDASDRLQWAGRLDEMASNAIAEAS